jgi:hypothetical protein
MAWRSTDGFSVVLPPFMGGSAIGEWQPTPPAQLPGALPQFATMTPWAIQSPSQFRPAGPAPLTSQAYADDVNETGSMGSVGSIARSQDQTKASVFWNGNTPLFWNRVAQTMSAQYNLTLSENSRLFAVLNVVMADAAIACWDAKYALVTWRPITAIRYGNFGNRYVKVSDPTWTPLLITPNHPEYPSGHSTVSGSAVAVLQSVFGDANGFWLDSENFPNQSLLLHYDSFSSALHAVHDARVNGGIHFRRACLDGSELGAAVAQYILQNAFQSLHGQRLGQISHDHGDGSVVGQGEISGGDVM